MSNQTAIAYVNDGLIDLKFIESSLIPDGITIDNYYWDGKAFTCVLSLEIAKKLFNHYCDELEKANKDLGYVKCELKLYRDKWSKYPEVLKCDPEHRALISREQKLIEKAKKVKTLLEQCNQILYILEANQNV